MDQVVEVFPAQQAGVFPPVVVPVDRGGVAAPSTQVRCDVQQFVDRVQRRLQRYGEGVVVVRVDQQTAERSTYQ